MSHIPSSRIPTEHDLVAQTGRTWNEWWWELDADRAFEMTWHETMLHIPSNYPSMGVYWSHVVAAGYRRARSVALGRGYEAYHCVRISSPIAVVVHAWRDEDERAAWLDIPLERVGEVLHNPAPRTVPRASPDLSMDFTCPEGRLVRVHFVEHPTEHIVRIFHLPFPDREKATAEPWRERITAFELHCRSWRGSILPAS